VCSGVHDWVGLGCAEHRMLAYLLIAQQVTCSASQLRPVVKDQLGHLGIPGFRCHNLSPEKKGCIIGHKQDTGLQLGILLY
jgi:hypothetical protein